ncbi:MAG: GGDEF domain-containing protein [Spirochaetaceae bacterium]|nr:GGDEF domain-containing protein [Spirochaetaceae bacterium]
MEEQSRILLGESLLDNFLRIIQGKIKSQCQDKGGFITTILERLSVDPDKDIRFIPRLLHQLEGVPPESIQYFEDLQKDYKQWFQDFILEYPQATEVPAKMEVETKKTVEPSIISEFERLNRNISSSFNVKKLQKTLNSLLPKLGISCCSLFLFETKSSTGLMEQLLPPEKTQLFYSLEGRHLEGELFHFSLQSHSFLRWVPSNCHRLLLPLSFEDQLMGFMFIEDKEGIPFNLYESLRLQLSNFIKGQLLFEELDSLSLYDELSQLYNSRGFFTLGDQLIHQARRLKSPVTLFYLDIDGLKEINQHRGRSAGDQVLKDAASLMQNLFRKNDVLGRVGEDEFAVLAMGVTPENDKVIQNRLEQALEDWNQMKDPSEKFQMSISLSRLEPDAPYSLRDIISMAEYLMSENKEEPK